MKEGLNKVLLIGNIGKEPERKDLESNTLLKFSLATNERYKNRDGDWQDATEWHNVIIWGKRAEGLSKILEKGMPVFIEGKLQTRSWEGDNGKRYTTEVVVRDLKLLGRKRDDDRRGGGGGGYDDHGGGDPGFDDSDVPF